MLNIALAILSYDIWFYIFHLILHTKDVYVFHKQHHRKGENINYLDTYDGHWIENTFQGIGSFFVYPFYTFTFTDTFIILAFLNIRGMMRHDKRFIFLIGNHHILHHKNQNYNFGEYWIDSICGTLYPNKKNYIALDI